MASSQRGNNLRDAQERGCTVVHTWLCVIKEIWRWCGGSGGGGGAQGRRKVTSEPAAVSQTHVNTSSSDKSSNGGIPKFKFSLLFNLQTQNTSPSME